MTMPASTRAAETGLRCPQRSIVLIISRLSISSGCLMTREHLVPSPLPPSHGDLSVLQRDGEQQDLIFFTTGSDLLFILLSSVMVCVTPFSIASKDKGLQVTQSEPSSSQNLAWNPAQIWERGTPIFHTVMGKSMSSPHPTSALSLTASKRSSYRSTFNLHLSLQNKP